MRMEVFTVRPTQDNDDSPIWSSLGWSWVTLLKESSGDVVFGTSPDLLPANSGKGRQLPLAEVSFPVPPGTRIYLKSDNQDERVSITVTPLEFLNNMSLFFEVQAGAITKGTVEALRQKKRTQTMQPGNGG